MADFQSRIETFHGQHIKIIGVSTDTIDDARKMVEKNGLAFPIAYGLNGVEFCKMSGAFFHEKKGFIHATGFILQPDGIVMNAVYSTGPIGRLTASDTQRLIGYHSKTT
ncbi:MAG: hypothetical protein CSYNP_01653 [Syntrophus sp. SKADARSKE-3]|nr:hypothetical protein [Syntrophus sp. SKADARSKE-3]